MYINRNCYYTMKQTFDYLENVPNIAATVCDKEGIVLYQNKRAIDRDGDVVGKNLYNCHGENKVIPWEKLESFFNNNLK